MGRLRPAAGERHRGGDRAQERRGRQGALRADLRGRTRRQPPRPARGGKGKITGARGREGLRDWEEGTRNCRAARVRTRSLGPPRSRGRGAPRPHPTAPHPRPVPSCGCSSSPRAGAAAGGAVPPRGGRRAGRGGAPSPRLREAVRAGAGRVRPPGAVGRAAFLMCHQHVELARAARASGTPPTFEGSRRAAPLPAAPGSRSRGEGAAAAPRSRRVERGPGARPGARGGTGTSGRGTRLAANSPIPGGGGVAGSAVREGAACGGRRPARRSAPALRPADLSAGNRGGAQLGLAGAAWDRGEVSRCVTLVLSAGGAGSGTAGCPHLPHTRHCPSACAGVAWRPRHRTSCNSSWAGFGARGPRSGGAGAFLGGRRLGETQSVG